MKVSREERLARIRMNEGVGQHGRNFRRDRLRAQHFVRPTPVNPSTLSSSFTDYDSDATPKPRITKRMNPDGTLTTVRSSSVQFYDGGSTTIRETQFESRGGRESPYRGHSNDIKPPTTVKRRPNRPRPESPINRANPNRPRPESPINRANRIIQRRQQGQQLQTIDVPPNTTTNVVRYPSRGRSPSRRGVTSTVIKGSGNQIRTQSYSDDSNSYSKKVSNSPSPAKERNVATSSRSPRGSRMKIISVVNDGSDYSRSSKTANLSPQGVDHRGSFSPQSTHVELGSGNKEKQIFRFFGSSDSKKKEAKVKSECTTPDGTDDEGSAPPPPPPPSPSRVNGSFNNRNRGGRSEMEEEKEHRLSSSDHQEIETNPVNGLEMVQEEPGRTDQRFKPLSAIGRVRASQRYPKEIQQVDNSSIASSITTTPDRKFVKDNKMHKSQRQQQHHDGNQDTSPPMINRMKGGMNYVSTLQQSDLEDDAYLSSQATMGKPHGNSRRPMGSYLRTPPSQYSTANSGLLSSSPGLRTNDSFDKILNPTPPHSGEKTSPADTYESFDSLMSSNTERASRNGQAAIEMNNSRYVSRTKSLFDSSTVDSESLRTDPTQLSDRSLSTTRGFNVTVVKKSPNDKLGINVGRKKTRFGYRLLVTKISPTGLFVDSPIEVGDIVQSINGIDFLGNPNSSKALDVVKSAKEKITFVVRRPEDNGNTPDLRLPSLPHRQTTSNGAYNSNQTVTTTETWDDDGAVMVSQEESDDAGSVHSRRVHRRMINPDGSITVSTDDHSLGDAGPRIAVNESINVTGTMTITVTKKFKDEKLGLQLLTREGPISRVLYISKIDPTGPFGRTPLRAGDVVLSVNSFSFRENADAGLASSVIRNAKKDITIVARKSESSLHDFLLNRGNAMYSSENNSRRSGQSSRFQPPKHAMDETYEVPIEGKLPVMEVTFKKKHPSDRVGISMATRSTKLGDLLVVTSISPHGPAANTQLKAGDVILSVNGVDFEEDPDTEHAARIIRLAPEVVEIKFQRISGWRPAPDSDTSKPKKTQITQTILPGGERVVKTETFKADGTTTVKIEEFIPPRGIDVPLPLDRTESDVSGLYSLDMSEVSAAASFDESMLRMRGAPIGVKRNRSDIPWGSEIGGSPARARADSDPNRPANTFLPEVDSKGPKPTTIVAFKADPDQEVGLVLDNVKGSLVVAKISPTGMFAGKPILPGDKVVSVNSISFREDPDVSIAQALIDNAYQEVRLEIIKSEKAGRKGRKFWKPKSLFGLKRSKLKKIVNRSKGWSGLRRTRVGKSRDEPGVTPDTSLDKENEIPQYQ